MIKRIAAFLVIFCFSLEQCFAQIAVPLNLSTAASFSSSADKFRPVHLRSLIFDRSGNAFDLLLDKGDAKKVELAGIQETAEKLREYFLVGISLPDNKFWVNLRPDGAQDVIDPLLEKTDLGKVLLEADVALKKDLAKATSPDTAEGRKYWNKLYAKAETLFGKGEINIPTLARPWIVPGEIIVRQARDSVYVYKAALKVQLEQDYLKNSSSYNFDDPRLKELNEYSSSLIRDHILPVLIKKVNSSKTYAQLRQVYYSLILAQWFKKHFRGTAAEYAGRIDTQDLSGVTSRTAWSKNTYFEAYRKSFTDGEYNTRENVTNLRGMSARTYVSGGILPMPSLADNAQEFTSIRSSVPEIVVPEGIVRLDSRTLAPVAEASKPLTDGGVNIDKWTAQPFLDSELNPDMFRDYDYRSTGFDFQPKMGFVLGLEWARMALEKAKAAGIDNRTVVLARDARKIEPELVEAVSDALRYMGLNVVYTAAEGPNCVTSYSWALQQYKPLMSIFLTASHVSRPKTEKVRGFKVAMLIKKEAGVQSLTTQEIKTVSKPEVKELMANPELIKSMKAEREGTLVGANIDDNCVKMNSLIGEIAAESGSLYELARAMAETDNPLEVFKAWEARYPSRLPLRGMKVVVEGAHTPSGSLAAKTFERLGAQAVLLNGDVQEVEGEHNADPSVAKNLAGLKDAISAGNADMGIAFDLDGDRGAVVVPVRDAAGEVKFETLSPDNMIVAMLSSLIEKWGYNPAATGKQVRVIRDVLGTFAVNEKAAELSAGTEQTDAGYVFLKERRQQLLDQEEGYTIPIYGERSGHCWLDVTGEIENPIAVAVLFAVMVKGEKYTGGKSTSDNPFYETYVDKTIPYLQSPRFQPEFHPTLLGKLSNDDWQYGGPQAGNPPQFVIGLGKDAGVKALAAEFSVGKEYAGGKLKVKEFNSYQDQPVNGGLYRFADIVFADANNEFAGRFVFRASSNDPTFVCSYEAPDRGDKAQAGENLMLIGGTVLHWLEKNGFALVTVESIENELGLDKAGAEAKSQKLNLTQPEQHLKQYRERHADGGKADQIFMGSGEFMAKIDYVMRMLGIRDYPRITETFKRSIDPIAFVDGLDRISAKRVKEILSILDKSEFFRSLAADYRVRKAEGFDPAEYSSRTMSVSVKAGGYTAAGIQQDMAGQPISDYLRLMREGSAAVPFVFRDGMERFVGRFLGMSGGDISSPDLADIVSQMEAFLKTVDLGKIRYVVTSGIGANEMYSHQLAQAFNTYFKSNGVDVQWIVVNNPAHLNKLPASAVNTNTLVFEMSRSGTTKETFDFFNATRDRFKTRIVAANSGLLRDAAYALKGEGGNVMIISNTPGDIGGRQMNRKTLMVYSPLFMALAAGTKDIAQAKGLLRQYVAASLEANRELAYGNGLSSTAIGLAEFLFRHRASGRNKFSVVYDETLKSSAKELFQLLNEGANKNIAGGSNNNILDSYSFQADRARYETVFGKAAQSQLPIFLLNSNAPGYADALKYVEELNARGIPAAAITVDLGTDMARNLEVLARTSNFLQDMVVYFTYITSQDANSNPAVKMVREITAAMFEILQEKKQSGQDSINISFEDVTRKMGQKQEADRQKSSKTIAEKNIQMPAATPELDSFARAIKDLSNRVDVPETELTRVLISTVALSVAKADVGEAGGNKVADIDEAFARSALGGMLGTMSRERTLVPLDEQIVLGNFPGFKVSVAGTKDTRMNELSNLPSKLAEYFFTMYQQRKNDLQYLALTYMEADANNPVIAEIARSITGMFADLNITTPLLALPGVAHTGIEAIMSHPENVFNIAIVYTDTYGKGLGTQAIGEGVTVDDATYVYGISNVIRMALAGTPNIIFEVEDSSRLAEVKGIITDAMAFFRNRISASEHSGLPADSRPGRDGGKKEGEAVTAKDLGGIGFQALPMTDLTAIPAMSSMAAGPVFSAVQLDKQWREIRLDMVKGGVPCLKMKEYIAAARRDQSRIKAVATCVTDILKAEEEAGVATSASLKEVLAQLG